MKATKAALQNSSQEECGVWLDPVQLKVKAKQKRLARPISKLLNPFMNGEGYNLAVALNFTQTKMEMPKTKQSSIANFFTPHRRVLHKTSSSEIPNPVRSLLSSISTVPTAEAPGKKRERDVCPRKSDFNGVCEWGNENVPETKAAAASQNQGEHISPLLNRQSEEFEAPQSKKRHIEPSLSQLPPLAWSQDPLFTCSQDSEREFYQMDKKYTPNVEDSESSFSDSLQFDEVFGNLKGRTSTQNPDKRHNQKGKENGRPDFLNSPTKHSSFSPLTPLSSHNGAERKSSSLLKHTDCRWIKPGKEGRFDSARSKPSTSPLTPNWEVNEDAMATLFTQDSEGFRVIAHRDPPPRRPLKDQSNLGYGMVRSGTYKPVEEDDEEDEMLFTQDSQGHMVIKH
uniref:Aurora kinase A and ninein-interacting protein n=1 Tax=Iconisemion striatum TaxID=60296 RepID=A0A1A7WB61_9TELE